MMACSLMIGSLSGILILATGAGILAQITWSKGFGPYATMGLWGVPMIILLAMVVSDVRIGIALVSMSVGFLTLGTLLGLWGSMAREMEA